MQEIAVLTDGPYDGDRRLVDHQSDLVVICDRQGEDAYAWYKRTAETGTGLMQTGETLTARKYRFTGYVREDELENLGPSK